MPWGLNRVGFKAGLAALSEKQTLYRPQSHQEFYLS